MRALDLVQINFFKFLINDLKDQGFNLNQLLKASNLNRFNLEDTDGYVPLTSMYHCFDNISKALGIEDFISVFNQTIKVQNLHNYGSFMLSAPDIISAAKYSLKFSCLNFTSEVDGLEINGPITKFWISLTDKDQPGKEHAYAIHLAFIIDHLRLACGDEWVPIEIEYPSEKLPDIDSLLPEGHNVRFVVNQNHVGVTFPTSVLNLPVLRQSNQDACKTTEHPFGLKTLSHQERIEQILNAQVVGHIPTLSQLAEWFGKSTRSLQRLLSKQQTSYFEILDQWRFKKAVDLLENSHLSNLGISAHLGYQKPESFIRSFRRWTNTSPQQYRDAYHA